MLSAIDLALSDLALGNLGWGERPLGVLGELTDKPPESTL